MKLINIPLGRERAFLRQLLIPLLLHLGLGLGLVFLLNQTYLLHFGCVLNC